MVNTLWLLVGRGGSRGVPGKNLRRIGGLTLLEWKVRAARAAGAETLVCSSDDTAILEEASRLECAALRRPDELATDTASSADVIRHALGALTSSLYDQVVLLEPSAPFTTGAHYRKALGMMELHDADLVIGMKETAPHTAFVGDVRADGSVTPIIVGFQRHARRRQDWPQQWTMSGGLYVFKTEMFLRTGDVYGGSRNVGLLMERWNSIEIDTPEDMEMAEYAYERGYVWPEGEPLAHVIDDPTMGFWVSGPRIPFTRAPDAI